MGSWEWRGRWPGVGAVVLRFGAPGAGGGVLPFAGVTASDGAAPLPLAFAIIDAAKRLATGGAAETRRPAVRLGGRFIASRPVAQKVGKKFSVRDHAPPQLREDLVFAAQAWRVDGAPVALGRVGL
jgi:hypothetical protein